MESYTAAFDLWVAAQNRVELAIQEYLNACVVVRDTFRRPPSSTPLYEYREQKLAELDSKLNSSRYMSKLQTADLFLGLVRDSPDPLSQINRIPLDVLRVILTHTVRLGAVNLGSNVMRTPTASITALSSVCTVWRRLMLRDPGLWTFPKLILTGEASKPCSELAKLWIERSRGLSLDLFVVESRRSAQDQSPNKAVEELMIMLMPRVRTLFVHASPPFTRDMLRPILNCWAARGTAGLARSLVFKDNDDDDNEGGMISSMIRDTYSDVGDARLVDFFRSLYSLAVSVAWDGARELVHTGLAKLSISTVQDWFPTLLDIGAVLAATPQLRSLCLFGIQLSEPFDQPRVVALDHLQTLTIESGQTSLWRILDIISTRSEDVEASIMVDYDEPCFNAVRSFLSRTLITRLQIGTYDVNSAVIWAVLVRMPYLRSLALQHSTLATEIQWAFPGPSDIWPALREVQLLDCNATPQALKHLVAIHPPQKLFWFCDPEFPSIAVGMRPEVEEILSEYGVEVAWVADLEEMPLCGWECYGSIE